MQVTYRDYKMKNFINSMSIQTFIYISMCYLVTATFLHDHRSDY